MKTITRLITLAVFIGTLSYSHAEVKSKVVDAELGRGLTNKTGQDGRIIAYPIGWMDKEGKDGRVVAYPIGWMDKEGKDGRVVAYPIGWMDKEGKDGRVVAYPIGWMDKEGKDGRVVAYPIGWMDKEGKDGRVIVVPNTNPAPLLLSDAANVAVVAEVNKTAKELANLLASYYWINSD